MNKTPQHIFAPAPRILLMIVALCAVTTGCRTGPLAEFYGLNPFNHQGPEETQYGLTPAQRRAEVIAMAQRAKKLPAAEKMRIADELALQMQNELDPIVRSDVVRALGQFNSESAQDALRLAMTDTEANIRIAACEAWGKMGGPEAVSALNEILNSDTDNDVRLAATRALGAFQDPAAVRGLMVALNDNSPAIQYRAMESLKNATGRDLGYDVVAWQNYIESAPALPGSRVGPTLAERANDRFLPASHER